MPLQVVLQASPAMVALASTAPTLVLVLCCQVEGHAVGQSLALPVAVTKFCSPPDAPLPRDLFFSQWRALAGAQTVDVCPCLCQSLSQLQC